MKNSFESIDTLSAFALTPRQTALLFSLQKACAMRDAESTGSDEQKTQKKLWAITWGNNVETGLKKENQELIEPSNLIQEFKDELKNTDTRTWFHLIILEAVTFKAYTPIGDKELDKTLKQLRYSNQTGYIENIISLVGYGNPGIAKHYLEMYKKATDKATGKVKK